MRLIGGPADRGPGHTGPVGAHDGAAHADADARHRDRRSPDGSQPVRPAGRGRPQAASAGDLEDADQEFDYTVVITAEAAQTSTQV